MSGLAHFLAVTFASLVALLPSVSVAPVSESVAIIHDPVPIAHATVLFGGDMMFDRSIRSTTEKKGGDFIFSCLDQLLRGQDLVVANLEGPITTNPSISVGTVPGSAENFVFTFPTSTAALLFAHNIRLVNIGNNHIENFGMSGVRSTIDWLTRAHVGYFGDTINHTVEIIDIRGVPFAFINYNEFSGSSASTTILRIEKARTQGKLPIVYTHWGIEYATTSSERIRNLAHRFVDSGAEIVIGSHPHIVEEREFYRGSTPLTASGKYIYYSLGNLIFDQYWDENVRRGLIVRVVFDATGVLYVQEIPVYLERNGRTCPVL